MFAGKFIILCLCLDAIIIAHHKEEYVEATHEHRMEFLQDFIDNQTETNNIVFIADHKDTDMLYRLKQQEDQVPMSIAIFIYEDIGEGAMKRINNANHKDNIPGLLIILQPEDKLPENRNGSNEVATKIRQWGIDGKIIIIFNRKANVKAYTEANIYNLHLFTPSAGPVAAFTQYDVCHLCNQGKDTITLTDTWRQGRGFGHKVQLQDSFSGNFHGHTIHMGTLNAKPMIYVTGTDDQGGITRDGIEYRKYMILSGMLKASWIFHNVSSGNQFQLTTGTGLLADLLEDKVDIVGGGWMGSYGLYQHVDFTASTLISTGDHILSLEPPKGLPLFGLLKPFSWQIWVMIICSVMADALSMYAGRNLGSDSDTMGNTMANSTWESLVILSWECIRNRAPPRSTLIFRSVYTMTAFLLVTLYIGDYTAGLVSPSYLYPPIDTFKQLSNSSMTVLVLTKGLVGKYANYLNNTRERIEVFEPVINEDHMLTILKKIEQKPDMYVTIGPTHYVQRHAEYFSQQGDKFTFHYSKEILAGFTTHLLVRKQFEYKEVFNQKITLMHDMGLMDEIPYVYLGAGYRVSLDKFKRKEEEVQLLTLREFVEAMVVLASGYALALLGFCLEVLWKKCTSIIKQRSVEKATKPTVEEEGIMSTGNIHLE